MTDKRIKEPCPFCGHPAKDIQIKTYQTGFNKIYCPECHVTFEGLDSKQAVIDKWNRRFRLEDK